MTTGETVLYSGLAGDDAPHGKGVALILSKEAGKNLKEWETIGVGKHLWRLMVKE